MRKQRNIRYSKPKLNSTFNNLHGDHTPQVIHRHNNPSTTFTNSNQRKFYTESFKRNIYQDAAIDEPPRKRSKPNSSFDSNEYNAKSMQFINLATKNNHNNAKNDNCIKFESYLHNLNNNAYNNKFKIDSTNNNDNYKIENVNRNYNKCANEITISINKLGKIVNPCKSNTSNIDANLKKSNDTSINTVSNTNTITTPPTQLSLPHYSQNLSDTQIGLEADKIIRHVFLDKSSSSSSLLKTNSKKSKESKRPISNK